MPRFSIGPVLSFGTDFPTYVVDDYCGATRSYGIGIATGWVPAPTLSWLALEGEAQFVTAPIDMCAIPDLPLAGERRVVVADLSTPFAAVNGRVVLNFPFGPGRLRFHAGGGVSLPSLKPIMGRGLGLVAHSGRLRGSLVLDWWTLWPGGEVFNEEWDEEGTRRDLIGPFDDWFHVRFARMSLGWAAGGR